MKRFLMMALFIGAIALVAGEVPAMAAEQSTAAPALPAIGGQQADASAKEIKPKKKSKAKKAKATADTNSSK